MIFLNDFGSGNRLVMCFSDITLVGAVSEIVRNPCFSNKEEVVCAEYKKVCSMSMMG